MKRIIVVLFVVSVMVLGLIGAVSANAEEVPTCKFGIDAAFPPWTWCEKGEVKGFEIELFEYIGKIKGFKIEPADLPWSTIISALSKGKIDILGGGLSFTCKRAKIIDYALPHWKIDYCTLVRKDSDLNGVTSMSMGHTIGAQAGTTGYRWCKEELVDNGVDVKLVGYETCDLGIKDVESGRIAAFHIDTPSALGFIEAGRNVKIIGKGYHFDINAFAVTLGDPHKLIPKINDGIKKAYESGKWAELVHKFLPWATVEKVPYSIDYVKWCKEKGEPLPPEEAKRAKENLKELSQ